MYFRWLTVPHQNTFRRPSQHWHHSPLFLVRMFSGAEAGPRIPPNALARTSYSACSSPLVYAHKQVHVKSHLQHQRYLPPLLVRMFSDCDAGPRMPSCTLARTSYTASSSTPAYVIFPVPLAHRRVTSWTA